MESRVPGFHHRSVTERLDWLRKFGGWAADEAALYKDFGSLGEELTDQLVENAFSVMEIPLGAAVNFIVNGRDIIIPMAVEESSVVAAASNAAKLARPTGGFHVVVSDSIMFSQIQVERLPDPMGAKFRLLDQKDEILKLANEQDPDLIKLGGGAYDLEVRLLQHPTGTPFVVVHLLVNVLDAMGANIVNTMAEKVAPLIEKVTGGEARLKIISNLADRRLAIAHCTVEKEELGGEQVVDGIVSAYRFAAADPYRAATHNKGIMNGVSAVVLATGNDTRAVEAGAHAYAARTGRYLPLSTWEKTDEGNLTGTLELPLAVGIVGGTTAIHPKAKANLKLMKVESVADLAAAIAAVGLAQNLAALRALATEGIQKGHMKMHAKNIALMAGARGKQVALIADEMIRKDKVNLQFARQLLGRAQADEGTKE